MANKYQVVDEVLRQQGVEGTYNVTFTNLNITDTENTESVEVVGAISDKVKENLKYSDLNEAPGIPEEGYEEVNEQEVVKDFHKVAFTGDYDHLENAPQIPAGIDRTNGVTFNEIAFTGNINLNNVQVSNVINLYGADAQPPSNNQLRITPPSDETNRLITDDQIATFNTVLSLFGQDDAYVLGFNPAGGSPLATAITSFYSKFKNTQLPSFFVTKAGIFFVLNAIQPSTTSIDYIQFDLAQVNTIDYDNTTRDDLAALFTTPISLDENGTNENAQEILNDITFTSKRVSFIFDFIKQIIICKVQEGTGDSTGINVEDIDVHDLQGLADVAISGSYTDLEDQPVFNPVAMTGNFDSLYNNYFALNFSEFIYKAVENNGETSYEQLTQAERVNMGRFGAATVTRKDVSKIYAAQLNPLTNENEYISLTDELSNLRTNFNNGKVCYLIINNNPSLVNKVTIDVSNNIPSTVTIQAIMTTNNFNTLMSPFLANSLTDTDIENITNSIIINSYAITIIFDLIHDILFSIPKRIVPFNDIDGRTLKVEDDLLTVNISNKSSNKIEIDQNNTGLLCE